MADRLAEIVRRVAATHPACIERLLEDTTFDPPTARAEILAAYLIYVTRRAEASHGR